MTEKLNSLGGQRLGGCSRRGFLAGTTALGLTILRPELVAGSEANSKITLALIGCGGRGNWIADLFAKHGGYQFVATADYFPDKAAKAAAQLGVPAERAFGGLSAYKRAIDAKPDAIVVETSAVFPSRAGRRGRGRRLPRLLRQADRRGRARLLDHRRDRPKGRGEQAGACSSTFRREPTSSIARRCDASMPATSDRWFPARRSTTPAGRALPRADLKAPEERLRCWVLNRTLSGDVITEQNIHALDVATWIVGQAPLQAYGACSKKGRSDQGNCNDHFAVIYTFPGDVLLSFASKQYGSGYDDIGCRMFGPKGTIETHYGGRRLHPRPEVVQGRARPDLYADGMVVNIADFHTAIVKGDYANATVAPSVRSNLTTILGRTAAYKKDVATWDEMMKSAEKIPYDMTGLKA